jgi:hypothetical protein
MKQIHSRNIPCRSPTQIIFMIEKMEEIYYSDGLSQSPFSVESMIKMAEYSLQDEITVAVLS